MYGCCSTECATIIHLRRRAKAIRKGIKNEIRFSKRKIRQATFQNNADPLAAIPDLTELAKRKPVAKKAVKIKKNTGKGAHFSKSNVGQF
jgi:UPF0176 protein